VTATGKIPVTNIGTPQAVQDVPLVVNPFVIAIKQLWENDWHYFPDMELVRCVAAAGGHEPGSCEIQRRYGAGVKSPHQASLATRRPLDLNGWWVKVVLIYDQGEELQWIGQISTERREIHSSGTTQSGVQHWVAYEPLHILRKIHVHESHWLVPITSGDPVTVERRTLGWIPDMNVQDTSHVLTGNRSEVKRDDAYAYGGTELWSRYDYLEYVLKHFVDESATGGPRWEIGGQSEILKSMTDTVRFGGTQTVAEIARRLVSPTIGLDFVIRPIPATPTPGFEVHVFALSGEEHTYGGATLPRNPDRVSINTAELEHVVRTHVASTLDQQYDRINVIGSRMVVCFSLMASTGSDGSLVLKWSAALEAQYKAGTGNPADAAEKHDEARESAAFDPVYSWFGAPELWDLAGGALARPRIGDDGTLIWDDALPPDYQNVVRRTLTELPLRDGFDYSTDPATDRNPSHMRPNLQRPRVWIWSAERERYEEIQFKTASINTLNDEWGIALEADPNYRLALNHFDVDTDKGGHVFDADSGDEQYDYDTLVATIAMETDQRFALRHELTSGVGGKGNEITIEVPDAELWILAGNTVVGVDPSTGQLQLTDGPRVLRNDIDRLRAVMAGAIARYKLARARADIMLEGYWPHVGMLGQVLDVIEEEGDTEYIDAPITSIEWIGGDRPMTVIRAGYAR
jgi:hypothetical protein